MDKGLLVPDGKILDLLMEQLLDPASGADRVGAVVDGFPRTPLQANPKP